MDSEPKLDDSLWQKLTQKSTSRKIFYEALFAKYEEAYSENGEIESTDDATDSFTDDEIETDNSDVNGTLDAEDAIESASEMQNDVALHLQTILKLRKCLASSQSEWHFPRWPGEDAAVPSSTTISETASAGGLLHAGPFCDNSHSSNIARHDVLDSEEADLKDTRRKRQYPPLLGDRDCIPEHHSRQEARKRRRTKKIPPHRDLEQSAASSFTKGGDTRSQKIRPLCISTSKVAKSNQSKTSAGRAQKCIENDTGDQSTQSDRDLGDKLASRRDVKVPCPRPECASQPTKLYQSGRFSRKEESELIQHQRTVHDFSRYPCTFEECPKRGGNGYYRRGNLVNHKKEKHGSDSPVKICSDSEDKLASRRDVKVPCPRPECASQPTKLYQSGRFSRKEESELIQHQRTVHDFSRYPCTFEECPKRGGNGYYRLGNLVKHEKEKHRLHLINKVLPNQNLDLFSQSEDELA